MFRALVAALAFALAPTAHAGGMFHGVRCGLGSDPKAAVDQLNERIQKVAGDGLSLQADLAVLATDKGVLACVLVNREDWLKPAADDALAVECVTATPEELAASRFGTVLGRDNQRLRDLVLTALPDGKVSACALNVPVPPPPPAR